MYEAMFSLQLGAKFEMERWARAARNGDTDGY
jgi:hypothetical protein